MTALLAILAILSCANPQHTPKDQTMAHPGSPPIDSALQIRMALALEELGPDYVPRTHHLGDDGAPHFTNRLILEDSPYLRQHAHNPVNWFPWGKEPFEKARTEGKPVILSVGYSTCHWCHVMERESFEDLEIAEFMNQNFISIKVDREVRPDVDALYMEAVHLMIGRGGWPMTVVMTPDGAPFFAGTYFPARDGDRGSRSGFLTILKELSGKYNADPESLLETAAIVSRRLAEEGRPQPSPDLPSPEALQLGVESLSPHFDHTWGGWGKAPKFPRSALIELMLRHHDISGDKHALEMAAITLTQMAKGGIYDQIGGGFHRYSTDRTWLLPHFEKMLYDNAQLSASYTQAWTVTKDPLYKQVASETLDYIIKEMTAPNGSFYSATDADSDTPGGHQEEGYFFTWEDHDLNQHLTVEEASTTRAYFGMVPQGNFEGRNILHRRRSEESVLKPLNIDTNTLHDRLSSAKKKLYEARKHRPAPLLDNKVITAWNGLMISGFSEAGFAFQDQRYLMAASTAADAVAAHRMADGRLSRTAASTITAFLEDYAMLIQGLLDVFEATGEVRHLKIAIELQQQLDNQYTAPDGGYFLTANDAHELLARHRPDSDGALPSGNSIATMNLLRLAEITQKESYRALAELYLKREDQRISRYGRTVPKLLAALDFAHSSPLQIIISSGKDADAQPLLNVISNMYLPNHVLLQLNPTNANELQEISPLVKDKGVMEGAVKAFVCQQALCQKPTSDPKELRQQLKDFKRR